MHFKDELEYGGWELQPSVEHILHPSLLLEQNSACIVLSDKHPRYRTFSAINKKKIYEFY